MACWYSGWVGRLLLRYDGCRLVFGVAGEGRGHPPVPQPAALCQLHWTAPTEVSSGEVERHRLLRAGNRKLNSALHHEAMSHKRTDTASTTAAVVIPTPLMLGLDPLIVDTRFDGYAAGCSGVVVLVFS